MWAFFARRVRVSVLCFLWRARAAERVVKRKGSRKGRKSGVTFPRRAERRRSRPTRRIAPRPPKTQIVALLEWRRVEEDWGE